MWLGYPRVQFSRRLFHQDLAVGDECNGYRRITAHLHRLRRGGSAWPVRLTFGRPDDGGWSAEMVLAHVVVGARLIAEAAGRVMAGGTPRFDNRAAHSEPYLHAIIEAAGAGTAWWTPSSTVAG